MGLKSINIPISIVDVDSSELAKNSFFKLRKIVAVYADTVMKAWRSVGVKEALVDRRAHPIDDQTVELHQVLDDEMPAFANPPALVELAERNAIKDEY